MALNTFSLILLTIFFLEEYLGSDLEYRKQNSARNIQNMKYQNSNNKFQIIHKIQFPKFQFKNFSPQRQVLGSPIRRLWEMRDTSHIIFPLYYHTSHLIRIVPFSFLEPFYS